MSVSLIDGAPLGGWCWQPWLSSRWSPPLIFVPSHGRGISGLVPWSSSRGPGTWSPWLALLVTSSSPGHENSFWLLTAFSRSHLKLVEPNVSGILQAILGGHADSFEVVEVEENIFKFSVSSKAVGLFIYNLEFFACSAFKVFFHLWNEKGV